MVMGKAYGLLSVAIIAQATMTIILPATRGYTALGPTIACILAANLTILLFARTIVSGIDLALLIPFTSAAPPLVALLAAAAIYREPISLAKAGLLLLASVLVGVAGALR